MDLACAKRCLIDEHERFSRQASTNVDHAPRTVLGRKNVWSGLWTQWIFIFVIFIALS